MSKECDHQPSALSLEQVAAIAREVLLTQGVHTPLLIVEGKQERLIPPLQDLAPTHDRRMEQMLMVGLALGESRKITTLEQVFFISEGRMSSAAEGRFPDVPPSQDPERKEVLIISRAHPRQGHQDVTLYEMVRGADGDLFELKPFSASNSGTVEAKTPLLDAVVTGFLMGKSGPGRGNSRKALQEPAITF